MEGALRTASRRSAADGLSGIYVDEDLRLAT